MCERTYDIIDWKSCKSGSERGGGPSPRNSYDSNANDPDLVPKTSSGSNSDHLVFPTLFYDDVTETSIVTLPDAESDCWRSNTREAVIPYDIEQLTVYQKVANWVSTQKGFFRKDEELVIDDDDLAVIDPVDLFQRSILDEYLLIAEDDVERRAILRDLNEIRCDSDSINSKSLRPIYDECPKIVYDDHRYDIESIHELMQTHEYRFIREPSADVELELEKIIDFGNNDKTDKQTKRRRFRRRKKKTSSASCAALEAEEAEDKILFLGVPRLLENYVVLNRDGYDVKPEKMPDLWLSPFEEDLQNNNSELDEGDNSELEFLSSWFSDVDRTGDDATTRHQTVTDVFEKLTVITVGSDDDIWQDVPEIPDWLDDGHEELELFNQPSRPLYYYRDRIKGCYRIIGVEDETVVLFSGNDDDTIFYPEEDSFNPILSSSEQYDDVSENGDMMLIRRHSIQYDSSLVGRYRRLYNRLRYGIKFDNETIDTRNDSGIDEDIDENTDDLQVAPPLSLPVCESVIHNSDLNAPFIPSLTLLKLPPINETFIECFFVVMGAIIVFITLALYKNGSPMFHMYRSKLTEELYDDLELMISKMFK